LLILAIALIVLGPKKLPEIAKSLGRGIAEFKKATSDFKQSMAVDNDLKEAKETLHGIKTDVEQSVRDTMAQGAATVSDDDEDEDVDDVASEKAAEHASEKDVAPAPPQESAENESQQQAEEKAKQEEPSSNA
jgi:TatA/E family protein of Tat protein translocase